MRKTAWCAMPPRCAPFAPSLHVASRPAALGRTSQPCWRLCSAMIWRKRRQIYIALDFVRMALVLDLPAIDLTWCCPPRSTGEQSFSLLVDSLMRRFT